MQASGFTITNDGSVILASFLRAPEDGSLSGQELEEFCSGLHKIIDDPLPVIVSLEGIDHLPTEAIDFLIKLSEWRSTRGLTWNLTDLTRTMIEFLSSIDYRGKRLNRLFHIIPKRNESRSILLRV